MFPIGSGRVFSMLAHKMNRWQRWGITVLRVTTGVVFLMHGGQKLFVDGFSEVAGHLGGPFPLPAAIIVSLVEPLCAAALVLGLFTRVACVPLAIGMLVDILVFHPPSGFFVDNPGYQLALLRLAASGTLMLTGPGEAAIDNLRAARKRRMFT